MQKIVVNVCYGGFGLSKKAIDRFEQLSGKPLPTLSSIGRDDPNLIRIVEELGDAANTSYSKLRIVEIPDDVHWTIAEYDGYEHVAEVHRTWYYTEQ